MTEAAGEVADGMLLHPFHTERSLEEVMMPSLQRGLGTSGRTLADFALCAQVIIVTGTNEAEHQSALAMARNQIAFYASTPAYRSVLESEGCPELQAELRQMTKEARWHEMASKIDDDLLGKIAAVGTPKEGRRDLASPLRQPRFTTGIRIALPNRTRVCGGDHRHASRRRELLTS